MGDKHTQNKHGVFMYNIAYSPFSAYFSPQLYHTEKGSISLGFSVQDYMYGLTKTVFKTPAPIHHSEKGCLGSKA